MADRIVTWKAIADFSKIRKEARETTQSLKDLKAQEQALNAIADNKSGGKLAKAHKDEGTAVRNLAKHYEALARARERAAEAGEGLNAALQTEVGSHNRNAKSVVRNTTALVAYAQALRSGKSAVTAFAKANTALADSFDATAKARRDSNKVDNNTKASRDNAKALLAEASAQREAAEAIREATKATDDAAKSKAAADTRAGKKKTATPKESSNAPAIEEETKARFKTLAVLREEEAVARKLSDAYDEAHREQSRRDAERLRTLDALAAKTTEVSRDRIRQIQAEIDAERDAAKIKQANATRNAKTSPLINALGQAGKANAKRAADRKAADIERKAQDADRKAREDAENKADRTANPTKGIQQALARQKAARAATQALTNAENSRGNAALEAAKDDNQATRSANQRAKATSSLVDNIQRVAKAQRDASAVRPVEDPDKTQVVPREKPARTSLQAPKSEDDISVADAEQSAKTGVKRGQSRSLATGKLEEETPAERRQREANAERVAKLNEEFRRANPESTPPEPPPMPRPIPEAQQEKAVRDRWFRREPMPETNRADENATQRIQRARFAVSSTGDTTDTQTASQRARFSVASNGDTTDSKPPKPRPQNKAQRKANRAAADTTQRVSDPDKTQPIADPDKTQRVRPTPAPRPKKDSALSRFVSSAKDIKAQAAANRELSSKTKEADAAVRKQSNTQKTLVGELRTVGPAFRSITREVGAANKKYQESTPLLGRLAGATANTSSGASRLGREWTALLTSSKGLANQQRAVRESFVKVEEKQKAVAAAGDKVSKAFDDQRAASTQFATALTNQRQAVANVADAQAELDHANRSSLATDKDKEAAARTLTNANSELDSANKAVGKAEQDRVRTGNSLTQAQNDNARATRESGKAQNDHASLMGRVSSAAGLLGRGLRNNQKDHNRLSQAVSFAGKGLKAFGSAIGSLVGIAAKVATGFLKVIKVMGGLVAASLIGQAIAALGSSFVALIGAIAPAVGVLNVLPAVFFAAGAGAAALAIGLKGVGGAFKALGKASEDAGSDSAANAKAQEQAAKQVRSAQQGVEDAVERVADAQRTARNASESLESAIEGQARAERAVTTAQKAAEDAQKTLNQAREDATRQLQDMNAELAYSGLDEEGAVLATERAYERLLETQSAGAEASVLDRKEADLSYRQSLASLEKVRVSNARLAVDTAAANAAGVEGADQVVAAQQGIVDAAEGQVEAQRGVRDANRGVRDAAEGVDAAQRGVADANRGVAEAQITLAEAIRDSATAGTEQSASAKAAAEAMAKLSANAQDFVTKMRALAPEWDALRRVVQDRLFEGMGDAVGNFARIQLPVLKDGLANIAGSLNGLGKQFLTTFSTSEAVSGFQNSLSNTGTFFDNLTGAVDGFGRAFIGSVSQGSNYLPRLGDAISKVGQAFGDFVAEAIADGSFDAFIENAISICKQLGQILKNVGSILSSVFGAGQETGGGFLNTIEKVTAKLAEFFNSPVGERALQDFFSSMADILTLVLPLFGDIASIIGSTVAPALADFARGALPGVRDLLLALGEALKILAPQMGPLGRAFGDLLIALVPLAEPLGRIAALLAENLAASFYALIEAIGPVLPALGEALVGALAAILPLIPDLIRTMGPLIQSFAEIFPEIAQVAATFAEALGPILPVIAQAFTDMAPSIAEIARTLGDDLGEALILAAESSADLTPAFLQLVDALLPFLPPMLDLAVAIMPAFLFIMDALVPVISLIAAGLYALTGDTDKAGQVFGRIDFTKPFRKMLEWSGKALDGLANLLISMAQAATKIPGLGDTIARGLAATGRALKTNAQNVQRQVEEMAPAAEEAGRDIPGAISSPYVSGFDQANGAAVQGGIRLNKTTAGVGSQAAASFGSSYQLTTPSLTAMNGATEVITGTGAQLASATEAVGANSAQRFRSGLGDVPVAVRDQFAAASGETTLSAPAMAQAFANGGGQAALAFRGALADIPLATQQSIASSSANAGLQSANLSAAFALSGTNSALAFRGALADIPVATQQSIDSSAANAGLRNANLSAAFTLAGTSASTAFAGALNADGGPAATVDRGVGDAAGLAALRGVNLQFEMALAGQNAATQFGTPFTGLGKVVVDGLGAAGQAAIDSGNALVQQFVGLNNQIGVAWSGVFQKITQPLISAMDQILAKAYSTGDALNAGFQLLVSQISIAWQIIEPRLVTPLSDALTEALALFGAFSTAFLGQVERLRDEAGVTWAPIYNLLMDPVNQVADVMPLAFKRGLDASLVAFNDFLTQLQGVWRTLPGITAGPVNEVIEKVINNGVGRVWQVTDELVGGSLPDFKPVDKITFARGGVMPGYTPGRDPHKFTSPTGGRLELSGGEAVMRPEFTAAVGKGWVDKTNKAARSGGVAGVRKAISNSADPARYFAGGVIGGEGGSVGVGEGSPVAIGTEAPTFSSGSAGGFTETVGAIKAGFGDVLQSFASGGVIDSITAVINSKFPGMTITSTYRAGDPGNHGAGLAVDFSNGTDSTPGMRAAAAYIAQNYPPPITKELIHSPFDHNVGQNKDVGDGFGFFGAQTMSEHRNHVHWAANGPVPLIPGGPIDPALFAAAGVSAGPTVGQRIDEISKGEFKSVDDLMSAIDKPYKELDEGGAFKKIGVVGEFVKHYTSKAIEAVKNTVKEKIAPLEQAQGSQAGIELGDNSKGYANEIYDEAIKRGLGDEGAIIAFMTAFQESGLRILANPAVPASLSYPNDGLGYDHDSVGIFQQRQAGWGSLDQRMNARASAGLFFNKLASFNWRAMSPGAAAQKVQVSAKPDAYDQWYGKAVATMQTAKANRPVNPGSSVSAAPTTSRKNGGVLDKIGYFATGGYSMDQFAAGMASKGIDRIPAMLAPGEFVMNAKAVKKFGLNTMHAMNDSGGAVKKTTSKSVQYFHSGGPVQNLAEGKGSRAIRGIKWLTNKTWDLGADWTPELSKQLRDGDKVREWKVPGPDWDLEGFINMIRETPFDLLNPRAVNWKFFEKYSKAGPMDMLRAFQSLESSKFTELLAGAFPVTDVKRPAGAMAKGNFNGVEFDYFDPNAGEQISAKSFDLAGSVADFIGKFTSAYHGDIRQLGHALYPMDSSPKDDWFPGQDDDYWKGPLNHAIEHALGMEHKRWEDRPWEPLTKLEEVQKRVQTDNENNVAFRKNLDVLATWGLKDLVNALYEMGPTDGLAVSEEAVKKRPQAEELNRDYAEQNRIPPNTARDLTNLIAHLSLNPDAGIRSAASALGVPDYGIVKLYETDPAYLEQALGPKKLERLKADVKSYRDNTFYAATGGQVPGQGTTDTQPAMLTPGEFVVKKKIAQMLGLPFMESLNNLDRTGFDFNAPSVPYMSASVTAAPNMAALAQAVGHTSTKGDTNIVTTINNPVREPSTKSLNAMLRRKAALGTFDPTNDEA